MGLVDGTEYNRLAPFPFLAKHKLIVLGVILLASAILRLWGFGAPILNHHWLRQVDTAAITRNFATEDMNILYPRVDWRGDSSGIVESEFPLYQYGLASLYKVFGEHVGLSRGMNLVFFLLTALVVFDFAKRMFDENTALLAVLLYGFNPLAAVFDHNFQPDSMMMLCSISAVSFYWRWCDSGRRRYYALSACALCVAILVKPLNVYLAAPLFVLTFRRYGWRFLQQWKIWLYAVLVLLPAVFWYRHAYQLWLIYGNTLFRAYSDLNYSALWSSRLKFSILSDDNSYAARLVWRLVFLWASVGSLVPLAFGALRALRTGNWVLIAWVSAFATTMIVFADQHYLHDYYQWPLAMIFTLLAASGIVQLWRGEVSHVRIIASVVVAIYLIAGLFLPWLRHLPFDYEYNYRLSWPWVFQLYLVVGTLLAAGFLLQRRPSRSLLVASTIIATSFGCWAFLYLTHPCPFSTPRQAFAAQLETLTRPQDRVVIAENVPRDGWYQHRSSHGELLGYMPEDFYFSRRKGWSVSGGYARPEFVETLRGRGAKYFAAFAWERPIAKEFPELVPYLGRKYVPLAVTKSYVIYRLDTTSAGLSL